MWRGWEWNGTRSHQAAALSSHERVEKRKFRAVFNIIIKRMGMEGQLMETLKLFRDLYIMMRWTWMRWPSERRRRMVRGTEDGKKMGNHIFYDHELQIAFPFLLLSLRCCRPHHVRVWLHELTFHIFWQLNENFVLCRRNYFRSFFPVLSSAPTNSIFVESTKTTEGEGKRRICDKSFG